MKLTKKGKLGLFLGIVAAVLLTGTLFGAWSKRHGPVTAPYEFPANTRDYNIPEGLLSRMTTKALVDTLFSERGPLLSILLLSAGPEDNYAAARAGNNGLRELEGREDGLQTLFSAWTGLLEEGEDGGSVQIVMEHALLYGDFPAAPEERKRVKQAVMERGSGRAIQEQEGESKAPLVLPWSVPDEGPAPSYGEYFSSRVDYGYDDVDVRGEMLTSGTVMQTQEGDYQVVWEDGVLYLDTYPGGGREGERLGEIGRVPSARVVLCDTRWIYLVVDGKELLRMDYRGERRTTLFTDGSGLMDRLMGDSFFLVDGKVMYLAAGTPGGGAGYYRLYLPEGRADLLYEYGKESMDALCFSLYQGTEVIPADYRISAPYPVSNHEFEWSSFRLEFYELYGLLLEDPEAFDRYFSCGWDQDEIESHIESDYSAAHRTLHYGNTLTDEHLSFDAAWTMLYGGSESPAWFDEYRDQCALSPLSAADSGA